MAHYAAEFPARGGDSLDDLHDAAFLRRGCCFLNFPCFRSRRSGEWERIPPSSAGEDEAASRSWWGKGTAGAGRRWKTFFRRFNRTAGRARRTTTARFRYDPMSYSLNFDQGEPVLRDFPSRYSQAPAPNGRQIHGGA